LYTKLRSLKGKTYQLGKYSVVNANGWLLDEWKASRKVLHQFGGAKLYGLMAARFNRSAQKTNCSRGSWCWKEEAEEDADGTHFNIPCKPVQLR